MGVYISLFFIVFIFSMLNLSFDKQKMKYIYIATSIFLILFVGLRDQLGGSDYFVYTNYFDNIPPINNLNTFDYFIKYEFLYKVLNSLVKTVTTNSYIFFLIVSMITMPVLLYFNYKICKYPFFTLLFYFYKTFFYTNFVALRQSIAMTIFIFALKYITSKDWKKYFICIAIASLFHGSAIVLFPLYFVNKIDLSKRSPMIYIIISGVTMFMSKYIVSIVIYLFRLFKINPNMVNKIVEVQNNFSFGLNLHVIEAIVFAVIFNSLRKKISDEYKVYYNLFIVYLMLIIAFSGYEIFVRISMYFYFIIMILLSRKLDSIKDKKLKLLFIYLFSCIFFFGYVKYLISFDNGGLLPYKTILFRGKL